MESPLVSVILPCFNQERFLAEALESVLAQTYKNLEILVVDDGSTDSSAEVTRKYGACDARLRLIQQPNGGACVARNRGIDEARGKYLALLDGDDYWAPTKIEKHVKHLEADPKVGVSFSATQFIDMDGKMLHRRFPKTRDLTDYDIYCRNPITNGSTPVFRNEVLREHKFDESKLGGHQDVDCWMRIAFTPPRKWKIEGVNEALTFYRVTKGSISDDYTKHLDAAKHSWEKSFQYAPEVAKKYVRLTEAFQLRFYARRAIAARRFSTARKYIFQSVRMDPHILWHQSLKTFVTLGASLIPLP